MEYLKTKTRRIVVPKKKNKKFEVKASDTTPALPAAMKKKKNASKRGVLWPDILARPPWRNAKSAITPRIMETQGGFA